MKKQTLRPSPTALLNPRLDPTFKAMFTQETEESDAALQSFLSSILGRNIRKVKLTTNEPAVETTEQMQMAFDVSVTFEDGEQASIEMQGRSQEYDYGVRSEIQAARLLNNNARKGDDWTAEKVYQISVLNFHYPKDDKCEMSWYTMKNQRGQKLTDHLNVIFIDLLEIKPLIGTPVEQLTALQKWGLYLSYADDESKTDYISQIAESEKGIMQAKRIIGRMSEEDSNWFREFSYDKARRDYNASMSIAKKKGFEKGLKAGEKVGRQEGLKAGLQEGLQEGLQKGAQKTAEANAINFLKMKVLTVEQIAEGTGLPVEKVKELAAKID